MSVHKVSKSGRVAWRVRWREGATNRQRTFDSKRDADRWDAEVRRRRQLGTLAQLDAGAETLDAYVVETWTPAHAVVLAPKTRLNYACVYDRHIAPALGSMPLREINTEAIAAWRGRMLANGTSTDVIHRAMKLLGSMLQRAAEAGRIPHNPARLVAKPKRPARAEVKPLAPEAVERLRLALLEPPPARVPDSSPGKRSRVGHERQGRDSVRAQGDATLVSVMAYAGLRPSEARGLRWEHIGERTLLVNAAGKTGQRSVRLLAPLVADLAAWRLASGSPPPDAFVFPGEDERTPMSANAFEMWRRRHYVAALDRAKLPRSRPYDLRHSFASLLLHEGRSVIYVARQLGHGANLTLTTYGHVVDELEGAPQVTAEGAIAAARAALGSGSCSPLVRRAA